jgi:hypothetical protein
MVHNLSGRRMEVGVGPGSLLTAFFWGQEDDHAGYRARTRTRWRCSSKASARRSHLAGAILPLRRRAPDGPTQAAAGRPFWYMRMVLAESATPRYVAVDDLPAIESSLSSLSASERAERDHRRSPGGADTGVVAGAPNAMQAHAEEHLSTGANYLTARCTVGDISRSVARRALELFTRTSAAFARTEVLVNNH